MYPPLGFSNHKAFLMPIFDIIHNLLFSLSKSLFFQPFLPDQETRKGLIFCKGGMTKIGRNGSKKVR